MQRFIVLRCSYQKRTKKTQLEKVAFVFVSIRYACINFYHRSQS